MVPEECVAIAKDARLIAKDDRPFVTPAGFRAPKTRPIEPPVDELPDHSAPPRGETPHDAYLDLVQEGRPRQSSTTRP